MMDETRHIRVLIVEDNEDDALLALRLIKQGGFAPESLRVDTRPALEAALRERSWDLVLCDYKMPGFSGPEALRVVQEMAGDVPFILISGTIGEENAVAMMKAGAHDYLIKDAMGRLVPAMERELREAAVRRERKAQHEALRESEQKFSTIFRQAPLLITLSDIDTGVLIDVNDKFLAASGFAREEAVGRSVTELGWITGEQRDSMIGILREKGRVAGIELALRRKDGGEVICLFSGEVVVVSGRKRLLAIAQDITDRQRAAERIRESEDKFRTIFENATDGILIADVETRRIVEANKAASVQMGYTRDEIVSLSVGDIHPKADLPGVLQAFERQLRGEISLAPEIPVLRKDGSIFYADFNATPIALGGKRYLIGVFRDITERTRAEAALRESEKRLRALIDAIPDAVFFKDAAGRHIIANRANEELYGLSPDKMIGKTVEDLLPPVMAVVCRRNDEEMMKRREIVRGEEHATDSDGKDRILDTIKVPIYDDSGNAVGLVGIARDITAAKRAEEKIRQSEAFTRSILDTVDEGFIVIDRGYRILTANKAYCDQAGLPAEKVVGRLCYEVSHNASRPCSQEGEACAVWDTFSTGESHTAYHKHRDGEGHVIYVETKAFPIKDASGTVTSVIETINNITEKHLLEEERLKTQKLESIGTLAGGIAHDFNNLLQGVFGYITMAKLSVGQKERTLEMLGQAERAVHQSVSLTSQLLTFAKGGKPVKQPMALAPIIENATRFALSGSRCGYRIDAASDLWPVDADSGQVGQVIQNIVLNADQAMPHGGVIEIRAKNRAAADPALPHGLARRDYVMIEVKDNGVGIPAQHLEKIFDPYFTTKEKGTGLGLATSYSIIRNHEGRIDVSSEVGRGSTFTIYVPAASSLSAGTEPPNPAARARACRVLVMDDEEIVRAVAGELIRALGHEAEFAAHGKEAIEKYRAAKHAGNPYDVVILDLTIRGGMDGLETIRRLREFDPCVKAIVSSGYSDDAATSNFRDRGFKAFLQKPYNAEQLQQTLQAVLG